MIAQRSSLILRRRVPVPVFAPTLARGLYRGSDQPVFVPNEKFCCLARVSPFSPRDLDLRLFVASARGCCFIVLLFAFLDPERSFDANVSACFHGFLYPFLYLKIRVDAETAKMLIESTLFLSQQLFFRLHSYKLGLRDDIYESVNALIFTFLCERISQDESILRADVLDIALKVTPGLRIFRKFGEFSRKTTR